MADTTLKIVIETDTAGAKAGFESVNEQTVTLKENLEDAGKSAGKFGDEVSTGAKRAEYSMMEARHSVMLVGEEMGLHIPRAVSMMIASIAPLGPLLEAAFPLLGAVALLGIIGQLINAHQEEANAARKAAIELGEFSIKQDDLVESVHRSNLELEDQIAKLEGRPTTNKMAIAMSEIKEEVDKLAESFSSDFDTIDKVLEDQVSFTGIAKSAFLDLFADIRNGLHGLGTISGTEVVQEKLVQGARAALFAAQEAREKTIPGSQANIEALRTESIAYGNLSQAASDAAKVMAKIDPDNFEAFNAFTKEGLEAAARAKVDLEEIQKIGLKKTAVAHEDDPAKRAAQEAEIAGEKAVADARIRMHEEWAKEDLEQKKISIDQETALLKQAADDKLAAETKFIQDKIKILSSDPTKNAATIRGLNAQLEVAEIEHQMAMDKIDADGVKAKKALADKIEASQKELMRSNDELLQSEQKLTDMQSQAKTDTGVDAVKDRMQRGIESVREGTAELAALYREDANNRVISESEAMARYVAEETDARAALAAAIASNDQVEINKKQAELDAILAKENKSAADILKIHQDLDKKLDDLEKQRIAAREKYENQFNKMFSSSVTEVLSGHEKMGQAAIKMYNEMMAKMIQHFIEKRMRMLEDSLLHKLLAEEDVLTTTTAETQKEGIETASHAKSDLKSAKTAAKKAYTAFADIPVVGPELGAVAAAAAFAFVMAFDTGGMSPGGLSLLHPREAVLNPQQTENFRRMTENNSTAHTFNPTFNIHGASDAKKVGDEVMSRIHRHFRTNFVSR